VCDWLRLARAQPRYQLEPIRGGQQEGGTGFIKGVGKGLTGLVLKPLSGILQLGSKTVEGIATTPLTIADKIKGTTYAVFPIYSTHLSFTMKKTTQSTLVFHFVNPYKRQSTEALILE
jgi:hypothetical protein